jgi:Protein of unknown function (DUF4233)
VNSITLSARNPMRTVLLSVLIFEVIVFGLSVPVMVFNSNVAPGTAIGFAGGAALLALLAAVMLRRPAGYALGWLTQVVALALGVLTPTMFVVGGLFAGLWALTFVLGKRLDAAKDTGGP